MHRSLLSAFALAFSVGMAPAQWVDGELIVDTFLGSTGNYSLLRVDPTNGNCQILLSGYYPSGYAGRAVFDAYRDAFFFNTSLPPDPYWFSRLWVVQSNGTATSVPGIANIALRGMCSVGDGRVYYQHHNPTSNEIHYLDAANTIHTLMDASGTSPFLFQLEHTLYHAPTNSLIVATSGAWSTNNCSTGTNSIFRVPLSLDGTRVVGAPICMPIASSYLEVMSLGYMPGGDVLLCLANGTGYFQPDLLLRVNPVTLAASPYASPTVGDIDGACYSARIGQTIVLDDANNVLRKYAAGSMGPGTVLPTSLPVSWGTSGYAPPEAIWLVDRNGPGCQGAGFAYGSGLAGAGGFVPTLGVVGCPDLGTPFTLSVAQLVGGAIGLLALGDGPAAIPALGGTLLVFPIGATVVMIGSGVPGSPGVGNAGLSLTVTTPSLIGAPFYFQAGFLDPAGPQGWSLTNGLQLVIG